ncbi:hypothetical protein PAXINDRAFT_102277 [Paxillus involutus ATCC 200175]|uniref:Uncharacterized protein n=1 Tax=Paxillus involutus ATCC 200175 TaxID=664439 RepID=A0A0C9TNC1_PAXIN|nr:hypothetical protein PAXINDRAFT_102277 [Paxillus involutus ATCC 200175]
MTHMKNIRELVFFCNTIKNAHWDVIANLESLEELSFTHCKFVDRPADEDHGKRLKVKVPCLRMTRCNGVAQLTAAIDALHLRTLTMGFQSAADQADWLSKTSLTDLYLNDIFVAAVDGDEKMKYILGKIPQSIQVMTVPINTPGTGLFGDLVWQNMPLLRSLTLKAMDLFPGITAAHMICESIRVHRSLQSFTLNAWPGHIGLTVSAAEVRHMVQEQLGNLSELNFVDIYGTAVRLVDGKWIDVAK